MAKQNNSSLNRRLLLVPLNEKILPYVAIARKPKISQDAVQGILKIVKKMNQGKVAKDHAVSSLQPQGKIGWLTW